MRNEISNCLQRHPWHLLAATDNSDPSQHAYKRTPSANATHELRVVRDSRGQYVVLARRYDSNAPGVRESCRQRRSISFSDLSALACRPKVESKPPWPAERKAAFRAGARPGCPRLRPASASQSLGPPSPAMAASLSTRVPAGVCRRDKLRVVVNIRLEVLAPASPRELDAQQRCRKLDAVRLRSCGSPARGTRLRLGRHRVFSTALLDRVLQLLHLLLVALLRELLLHELLRSRSDARPPLLDILALLQHALQLKEC